MKALSRILFPAAVAAMAVSGAMFSSGTASRSYSVGVASPVESCDTVVYPHDGYKLHRNGMFAPQAVADSLLAGGDFLFGNDTLPHLSARDTIKVPDSLRYSNPFRYKYYVALVDSLTHRQVRDSLMNSFKRHISEKDTLAARADSMDWRKLDSLYAADSTVAAKAAFKAWYESLSKSERKKYDYEQMVKVKMALSDSLRKAHEDRQAEKDSIIKSTPRILETFALTDSLQYKRLITWTVDQDFHKLDVSIPDTSYNYNFNDYPFLKKDINATWLGVAGSPVQTYDFFKRESSSDVDFYTPQESWSYSPSTLPMYNTKTPYTELAYWGTILSGLDKESDNFRIFTTQNITPELNVMLRFERFGGGGILVNEQTKNKNLVFGANYLGKKYMMHAGFIHNTVIRQENGGITDDTWVRDTTVDARDIAVRMTDADSKITRSTLFLDQQLRIPFNFIEKMRAKRDSSYVANDTTLNKDLTSAFIGHSSEFSVYSRKYTDNIALTDTKGRETYDNYYFNETASADSMRVMNLDNKIFIRLQPWSSEAIVSKLNVGIGDRLRTYFDSTSVRPVNHVENSIYLYAGAEGQYRKYVFWDAKGDYTILGTNFSDFKLEGNAKFNIYPFRRDRNSPLSIGVHAETSLREPNWYQKHINTNHFFWDNDSFGKISTTKLSGSLDIPRWRMRADVGYALLANNIYYDDNGIVRQNGSAMSVLSASLRKDLTIANFLHLDNRALLQFSSNEAVMPLPTVALNLRWYAQFVIQRDAEKLHNVMEMQIGVNAFYNTPWYSPAWNPDLGVFHNQHEFKYESGPVLDAFVNIQWKRACIFIKFENAGMGWPMDKADYFSASHFIRTQRTVKVGLFWPFYLQPNKNSSIGGGGAGQNSAPGAEITQ